MLSSMTDHSTARALPDGSLTLDNASVQRLMDYGLLHYTNQGWIVGKWEDAVRADTKDVKGKQYAYGNLHCYFSYCRTCFHFFFFGHVGLRKTS